jgi:hypothetical protein
VGEKSFIFIFFLSICRSRKARETSNNKGLASPSKGTVDFNLDDKIYLRKNSISKISNEKRN